MKSILLAMALTTQQQPCTVNEGVCEAGQPTATETIKPAAHIFTCDNCEIKDMEIDNGKLVHIDSHTVTQ